MDDHPHRDSYRANCSGRFAGTFFINNVTAPGLSEAAHFDHPTWLPVVASMVALTGIGLAWTLYGRGQTEKAAQLQRAAGPLYPLVCNKFYIDEMYLFITHKVIFRCIAAPIKWVDRAIVDGSMNLCGWLIHLGGKGVRLAQNGQLQLYLGLTVIGFVILLFIGK